MKSLSKALTMELKKEMSPETVLTEALAVEDEAE